MQEARPQRFAWATAGKPRSHEGTHLARQARRPRRRRSRIRRSSSRPTRSSASPRPAICGSDLHLYEVLGPFIDEGDILGHEPMGIVEEVGSTVTHIQRRRPRGDPLQHLLRALLDVRPAALRAVRDDPGARAGHGCRALRLHEALRAGARRPGGVPARPAGPVRPDQGPRGPAGRALPLPLRRAADVVAGRRVRRHPRGRQRGRLRARPDRPDERADRPPSGRAGHRRRSRARAPRDGPPQRDRGRELRGARRRRRARSAR